MDFSLCRSGALGLEPNWQKSAKPDWFYVHGGGEGGGWQCSMALKKSTINQMKNLQQCLLNSEYRNATSKYLKIMLFYYIGRSGILVIKM
jgi:hypothetical protein